MAGTVAAAPLLVALVAAVLALAAPGRRSAAAVSVVGVLAYAGAVAALVAAVLADPDGVIVYALGGWPAPFGIVFVADALAAFVLALGVPVAVAALVASLRQVSARAQGLTFHPLFHLLLVGVSGAVLTGDLFNLFVWFEVMLMASYVLVVLPGGPAETRGALRYLVLNLVGSAVMLVAIGGLYATAGTLNMAHLGARLAAGSVETAPVLGLSGLLLAVFALKAGAVPFQFWVPATYRAAPAPVAAMLAGVTKKVGVYAIVRLSFTVLGGTVITEAAWGYVGAVVFASATASVVLGGVAAVRRDTVGGLLAFSSIGQVGFILLPLAVAVATTGATRRLAIAATLVYALNHALAKGLLFLAAGAIEDAVGTDEFGRLGGLAGRFPVLSAASLIGGLALVGIPPLSGFFAKLLVFDAATGARAWAVLAVALGGALLTVAYVSTAWNRAFWGPATPLVERAQGDPLQTGVLVALAAGVLAVGVGFDPVFRFAELGAAAALDAEGYADAVLGGGGT